MKSIFIHNLFFSFLKAQELQQKIDLQMKKEDIKRKEKKEFHRNIEMNRIKKVQSNEVYANVLKRNLEFGNFEKQRAFDLHKLKQNLINKKNELINQHKTHIELQKNLNKTKLIMEVPGSTKKASNLLSFVILKRPKWKNSLQQQKKEQEKYLIHKRTIKWMDGLKKLKKEKNMNVEEEKVEKEEKAEKVEKFEKVEKDG